MPIKTLSPPHLGPTYPLGIIPLHAHAYPGNRLSSCHRASYFCVLASPVFTSLALACSQPSPLESPHTFTMTLPRTMSTYLQRCSIRRLLHACAP